MPHFVAHYLLPGHLWQALVRSFSLWWLEHGRFRWDETATRQHCFATAAFELALNVPHHRLCSSLVECGTDISCTSKRGFCASHSMPTQLPREWMLLPIPLPLPLPLSCELVRADYTPIFPARLRFVCFHCSQSQRSECRRECCFLLFISFSEKGTLSSPPPSFPCPSSFNTQQ